MDSHISVNGIVWAFLNHRRATLLSDGWAEWQIYWVVRIKHFSLEIFIHLFLITAKIKNPDMAFEQASELTDLKNETSWDHLKLQIMSWCDMRPRLVANRKKLTSETGRIFFLPFPSIYWVECALTAVMDFMVKIGGHLGICERGDLETKLTFSHLDFLN